MSKPTKAAAGTRKTAAKKRKLQPPAKETVSTQPPAATEKVIEKDSAVQAGTELPKTAEGTIKPEGADNSPRPKKKVLLIEDDETILMMVEMWLRTYDFDCVIAENGKAAQEVLLTVQPDVIMVDLFMPIMDGLAFIQWLRDAKNSTPILVVSTVLDPKIQEEAFRCGANGFARKPLDLKELVATLNKLISTTPPTSVAASA